MASDWRRPLLPLLVIGGVSLAQGPGMHPRPSAKDYPASVQTNGLTIGAAVLSKQEVRNSFATDLNRGYLVFEVGVFPDGSSSLTISPEDFMAKMPGEKGLTRPLEPPVIARSIQEQNEPKLAKQNRPEVVAETDIGYISGGYDPVTGQKRKGTVVTASSVGVTAGGGPNVPVPPKGPYSDADRDNMQAELADKSLPQVSLTQPVAGYLYFPANKKKGAFELHYLGRNGSVIFPVPAPSFH